MSSFHKKRGGHRAISVRLIGSLSELFRETTIDTAKVESILLQLKRTKETLIQLDDSIQDQLEGEELEQDLVESTQRIVDIDTSIISAERALKAMDTALQSTINNISNVSNNSANFKLPTLQLPTFDGNPIEWQQFWDVFSMSVHNSGLSEAQKFTYLRGQLKKEAFQLIDGFTTTDAHYNEAVNLLQETYGKKHKIVQAHIHAIFDLESPKANSTDLSRFRAKYESNVRSLKALDTKIEEAGFIVAALLLRKLPVKIRDNINRAQRSDYWELNSFRDAINAEIALLQSIEPEERKLEKLATVTKGSNFKTASNLTVSTIRKCLFCREVHSHYNCTKYQDPQSRLKRCQDLKLCINCLSNKHYISACKSIYTCKNCHKRHHTLLCKRTESSNFLPARPSTSGNQGISTVASVKSTITNRSVALPTAMLSVYNNFKYLKVRALFDQGSQRTFILRKVAIELGLRATSSVQLAIDGFLSKGNLTEYSVVHFKVLTKRGYQEMEAIVVDSLPSRISIPGLELAIANLKSLIFLADPDVGDNIGEVSILVGSDQYYNYIDGFQVLNDIHVLSSSLGNMISGQLPADCSISAAVDLVTVLKVGVHDVSNDESLQRMWDTDSMGINVRDTEDDPILEEYERTLGYRDGHYVVGLPWRPNHRPLSNNYGVSLCRLKSLLNRLSTTPGKLKQYNDVIQSYLKNNFIEKIDSVSVGNDKIHYLPHHCVEKDSATTPLRIVFDCSSGKPSLNECLFSGPSLMHELGQILLRFRLYRFACITDIAKAFLQVTLLERDRDSTRFLWPTNPEDPESAVEVFRFKVVLFGATCSQFLLNATIRHHLQVNGTSIASQILRNIYVDNIHYTADSETSMIQFYNSSKNLMSAAGLTLREWATNSPQLQGNIKGNADGAGSECEKFLGMVWNTSLDTLSFPKFDFFHPVITKRIVVSEAGRTFDPLGFLNPVIILSRIFIQELWTRKVEWDQPLDEDLARKWQIIIDNIRHVTSHQVPRCVRLSFPVAIHAFGDASNKAYGAVVYFTDSQNSQYIISKVKVAPLKELSIPRLELMAALIAARLVTYVLKAYSLELKHESIFMWSDSMVVLNCLQSKKTLKLFVKNRVLEIQKLLPDAEWRYVTSGDNPADMLTRGIGADHLLRSDFWDKGPVWLPLKEKWPIGCEVPGELVSELERMEFVGISIINEFNESPIEINKYSSFDKLIHITVLVFRFIKLMRRKLTRKCRMNDHDCTVDEIQEAEIYWIKQVQREAFPLEIDFLNKKTNRKPPNLIRQLGLMITDDGLLRCKGRIHYAEMSYDARHPILLPGKHKFIELFLLHYHYKLFHAGVSSVMNCLRQKFWIPRLRQRLKTILRSCLLCRKLQARPYIAPASPPLMVQRVTEAKPFACSGVDYTGSLTVKERGQQLKVYICLFTCASIRAVHLEVAEDSTAETFMKVFRRFISRRSCPSIIYSDNSKTFTHSAEILKRIQNHFDVKALLRGHHCQWRFITSRSPWMGGFWERMIGLTKTTLKKVLGSSCVTMSELQTIIVEIEASINDRPLTYVGNDLNENAALTPSHLLYGFMIQDLPTPMEAFEGAYKEKPLLSVRQKRCEKLKQYFWKRWQNEYLLSLRQRHGFQQNKPTSEKSQVKVGDIVLIYDEFLNRLRWKLGKIIELYPGKDGLVRSVRLKTESGDINRPLVHLYPMEISAQSSNDDISVNTEKTVQPQPRSVRKAALKARQCIKEQLLEE